MQLQTYSSDNKPAGHVEVRDEVFNQRFNEDLIHQTVTTYLANARQGTHAQKTRSEVRGGGIKPWRQKGTGRARAGTIRSPIWRKGGVTFAAKTQDYSKKLNKKMYRKAMCSILSELVRQERLLIVDEFNLSSHKTKDLVKKLNELKIENALFVLDSVEKNLYLASRNLTYIDVRDVAAAGPVSLVQYPKVVMTVSALKQFEEMFA